MKQVIKNLTVVVICVELALPQFALGQKTSEIPQAITTPDRVETRIGTLEFKDGAPSAETVTKIYDNLDFTHAFRAFVDNFQGASLAAAHKGFLDIGVKDNEVLLFSELMDSKSLFLTANADTVYFLGFIDLTKGPMVFEAPPGALGQAGERAFELAALLVLIEALAAST